MKAKECSSFPFGSHLVFWLYLLFPPRTSQLYTVASSSTLCVFFFIEELIFFLILFFLSSYSLKILSNLILSSCLDHLESFIWNWSLSFRAFLVFLFQIILYNATTSDSFSFQNLTHAVYCPSTSHDCLCTVVLHSSLLPHARPYLEPVVTEWCSFCWISYSGILLSHLLFSHFFCLSYFSFSSNFFAMITIPNLFALLLLCFILVCHLYFVFIFFLI